MKRACEKLLGGVSRKTLMLILALVVTVASAAGGTLAYLYGTQEVKNTFTYGDISIDLTESDSPLDDDDDPHTNEYEMSPGADIFKDPTVTVYAGSMDCYLYVEIDESWNFATFLQYTVADGWLPLEGVPGVYYREVASASVDQAFPVLAGDTVHVKDVSLSMLATLTDADYPRLTITAYAVQRDATIAETADPARAWALLQAECLPTVQ